MQVFEVKNKINNKLKAVNSVTLLIIVAIDFPLRSVHTVEHEAILPRTFVRVRPSQPRTKVRVRVRRPPTVLDFFIFFFFFFFFFLYVVHVYDVQMYELALFR